MKRAGLDSQRRGLNCAREICRAGVWGLALLVVCGPGAAVLRADVREPGKIRLARDSLQPALPGQLFSGVVEFTSPKDGVFEDIEIGGTGWEVSSIEFPTVIDVKLGQTIRIPFQADVKDGVGKLEIRVTVGGQRVEKKIDLSPERIAAIGKPRRSVRAGNVAVLPPGDDEGGPSQRGCDDYELHVHGRIEYLRPGVDNSVPPNGTFTDGFDSNGDGDYNDPGDVPDLLPAAIGVDGIRYQIIDDDSVDGEIIYEAHTDEQGNFDITTCWDDCDVSGCDDPDVYLRYFCSTAVVTVRGEDEEDAYAWSTIDSLIFNDSNGGDIDFGIQRPSDPADFPILHIHNSVVRTHRYVLDSIGFFSSQVGVLIQSDNGAFYTSSSNEIHIGPDEQWNEGTQAHEWGHHLLYEWTAPVPPSYCNGYCDDSNPATVCGADACVNNGGHCVWCAETDTDAWNEGFPDWLGSVLMRIWADRYNWPQPMAFNDGRYTLEVLQNCCDGTTHNALTTEGSVAALLRDMEDPAQDPGQTRCPQDALALSGDEILAVVREYRPIRVMEFINSFRYEYPLLDNDFRSTAQSVSPAYVMSWTSAPLQIFTTNGCGTYRTGETITLTAQANVSRYSTCMQWQRDGVNLVEGGRFSGTAAETLTITNAVTSDAGRYTLQITSCDGAMPNQCNGTQSTISAPISVRVIGANQPANRVTGWGRNTYGGLGRGTMMPDWDVNPGDVINLNNAVAVTAGTWNSHAILSDGTVWGWGYRYLGDGTNQTSATPVQANGLTDIVAVSGGGSDATSMALDASGHVWTWGSPAASQLGYPGDVPALNPVQLNLECVVDISMGYFCAAAVTGDGSLWVWGFNSEGQLGLGTVGGRYWTPQRVTDLSNVVEVECGTFHTLVRLADGTVWAAGQNGIGQLGDGTLINRNRFVQVIGLSNVTQIAAGWQHSLAVRSDSTPWGWGHYWALGTGSNNLANPTPAPVLNLPTVRALAAGNYNSAFVAEDGTIWTCGSWEYGQLCRPTGIAREPLPVDTRVGAAVQVSVGGAFMMAIAPGARIIAPVTDQIAAGCATARLTVGAVGEPPLSYQWLRDVGGTFVPLSDGGRISGATTPTLTIAQTDEIDTGMYRVAVANATNVVFNSPVTLITPPLLNPFVIPQDAADWWNNERGNWAVTDGAYSAAAPTANPATYTSFRLPQTDFLVELDVADTALHNYNANGGIWLRSRLTTAAPYQPEGVLLGFESVYPGATGDLFWQRFTQSGGNWPQNAALNVYTPGQAIHLRVEVRGDTYTAYLNDSPTPTTSLTTPNYPSGSIGLYDNVATGAGFDNVFIQSLSNCDPGSGLEPVRVIQRPQSQAVASGTPVTLTVTATGSGPLGYQWVHNGSCIAGANAPSYNFPASPATAGRYECTVTNACGSLGSYPAFVSIAGGPPGDMDGDGHVGLQDLAIVLSSFGACAGQPGFNPAADIDGDGCVGLQDLAILLGNFGA